MGVAAWSVVALPAAIVVFGLAVALRDRVGDDVQTHGTVAATCRPSRAVSDGPRPRCLVTRCSLRHHPSGALPAGTCAAGVTRSGSRSREDSFHGNRPRIVTRAGVGVEECWVMGGRGSHLRLLLRDA